MGKYLKLFNLTSEYLAYAADISKMILPNISYCKDDHTKVYYNQLVIPEGSDSDEPVLEGNKVLCKYNVSDTSSPITLYYQQSSGSGSGSGSGSAEVEPMFSSMIVDGVEQGVTNSYTFDTTGEHTVLFTLSEGETSISDNAFYDCSYLTSVTIPDSVTSIGDRAFYGCSGLISVIIGNSVSSIGNDAFYGCSGLTSITIHDSVTTIGTGAFNDCSGLTSITIPDSVTSIGNWTFQHCSGLTSITIPNSVTSIGEWAFYSCSGLTSITIPDSVTSICNYAFNDCHGLTNITIGNAVTSIGNSAFSGCSELTSITCNTMTAPTILSNTFRNVKADGTLTVPTGSTGYDAWMSTEDYYLGKYNWTKVEQ